METVFGSGQLIGLRAVSIVMSAWSFRTVAESAAFLHGSEAIFDGDVTGDEMTRRHVVACVPTAPALVLGSTQSFDDVNRDVAAQRGIEIVRRRSGGGAVWLHPDHSIWIDVWLPRADPLWHDDVGMAARWLGHVWKRTLSLPELARRISADNLNAGNVNSSDAHVGNRSRAPEGYDLVVHDGPFEVGEFGRQICFDSAASGEVFVDSNTVVHKIVGISQRRRREGARFQCALYRRWEPGDWADLFLDSAVTKAAHRIPVATCDVDVAEMSAALMSVLRHH